MKCLDELMLKYTYICNCHYCGINLHYRISSQNIYDGGPFYCGNCGTNVTEDIYGKKQTDKINNDKNNKQ